MKTGTTLDTQYLRLANGLNSNGLKMQVCSVKVIKQISIAHTSFSRDREAESRLAQAL
jgi:hypothetical protein